MICELVSRRAGFMAAAGVSSYVIVKEEVLNAFAFIPIFYEKKIYILDCGIVEEDGLS